MLRAGRHFLVVDGESEYQKESIGAHPSLHGWRRRPARKVADNSKRLKALEDLLDRALKIRGGVDLIVLPGGYFFSPEPNPTKMPMSLKRLEAAIGA
jgi:hypothetical protein